MRRATRIGNTVVIGASALVLALAVERVGAEPCDGAPPAARLAVPAGPFGELGFALAARGDWAIIGDPKRALTFQVHGAVVAYHNDGATWRPSQIIETTAGNEFGQSVAVSDGWFVVGSSWRSASVVRGFASFFELSEADGERRWISRGRAEIRESPIIALAADDRTVVMANPGKVRMLERDATNPVGWSVVAAFDNVGGTSVAVSGDVIVVGSPNCSYGVTTPSVAHVFRREAAGWMREGELGEDPRPDLCRCFGWSVSTDGSRIAVAAAQEVDRLGAGYVRIYTRSQQTGHWELERQLEHPAPRGSDFLSTFGTGVSILGDRLAIGSYLSDPGVRDAGAVYTYRSVDGVWSPVGSVHGVNEGLDQFGWRVALLPDALVATSSGYTGPRGGMVYPLCAVGLADGPFNGKCWPGIVGLYHFVNMFLSGSPQGDFNGDGAVTVGDLFDFLGAWSGGCVGR